MLWASLTALGVIVVAIADRLAAWAAERRIAARLPGPATESAVRLSAPLLPQLVTGRYREVRLSAASCSLGGLECSALTVTLTKVTAPVGRLLRGGGVIAGALTGTGTIGYAELSKRLPAGLTLARRGAGQAELLISGSLLRVPVSAIVAISEDLRRVTVSPRVVGVPWLVGFSVEVPALSPELAVSSAVVTDAGLAITVTGQDVAFGAKVAATEPKMRVS